VEGPPHTYFTLSRAAASSQFALLCRTSLGPKMPTGSRATLSTCASRIRRAYRRSGFGHMGTSSSTILVLGFVSFPFLFAVLVLTQSLSLLVEIMQFPLIWSGNLLIRRVRNSWLSIPWQSPIFYRIATPFRNRRPYDSVLVWSLVEVCIAGLCQLVLDVP
jgi:hypothetical protein